MAAETAAPAGAAASGPSATGGDGKTQSSNANTVARAGGPASTSYKVIDESAVTVPSKLPVVDRDSLPRPSGAEVADAARRLDIDLVFDADLLYIAEELLLSPVPPGWETHDDDQGRRYYSNKATIKTQWQHPMEEYYKGVVFMRKEGEQLLEEKASRSPPTPEETREMARYFGIDTKTELDLLEIAKAAVNAPLPPEWEEYEDDSGEVLFCNIISKKTSEHHPLDAYFLELVRQRRSATAAATAANGGKPMESGRETFGVTDFWQLNEQYIPYPWMEFVHPKNGQLYFYNFKDNVAAYCHPVHLIREQLKVAAAVGVQKVFRGWKARKDSVSAEFHAAASKIQRVFRGKKGRDGVQGMVHEKLVKAAKRIQRGWRSKVARGEEDLREQIVAAKVIQNRFKIRAARRRAALQERFGPRALPPRVDQRVLPDLRALKDQVTELLVSPTPFAAALATLDAFSVPQEAGPEARLKVGGAAAEGDDVVQASEAAMRGGAPAPPPPPGAPPPPPPPAGAPALQQTAAGQAPPTPVAPLASELGEGGGVVNPPLSTEESQSGSEASAAPKKIKKKPSKKKK